LLQMCQIPPTSVWFYFCCLSFLKFFLLVFYSNFFPSLFVTFSSLSYFFLFRPSHW
jgi:hypothetical protein